MEEIKKEPVTVFLMILNILLFLVVDFTGGTSDTMHMVNCGAAFAPVIIENHEIYRLFTSMFLHFGIEHLANNMLVLFVLGQRLEPVVGKIKFILIYLLGGLGGNILSLYMEITPYPHYSGNEPVCICFCQHFRILYLWHTSSSVLLHSALHPHVLS